MYNNNHTPERCTFFTKMGACRHGDGCTKVHVRPTVSPTVLFPMMYPNPLAALSHITDREYPFKEFDKKYLKKHIDRFYKEVWRTFMEYGRIAELRVVSNQGDHLLGNVYIRYEEPATASAVIESVYAKKAKFNGIVLLPELTSVTNFAEACCKEDLESVCRRGSQCNYLHIMKVSRKLCDKLEREQDRLWRRRERQAEGDDKDEHRRKRSRSRSSSRSRSPRSDGERD